jgi:uncharacterized protein (TIGR04376 family)
LAVGLWDELSKFLETRLDEFLAGHPDLQLEVLSQKLEEQQKEAQHLLQRSLTEQKELDQQIMQTAQEIKKWHLRVEKAAEAGRFDLRDGALVREAELLREGNLLWGKREAIQAQIPQSEELLRKIQVRRKEVQEKINQLKAQKKTTPPPQSWQAPPRYEPDAIREAFERWETEEELEKLKREMGR